MLFMQDYQPPAELRIPHLTPFSVDFLATDHEFFLTQHRLCAHLRGLLPWFSTYSRDIDRVRLCARLTG
jgi:hypothetical protein